MLCVIYYVLFILIPLTLDYWNYAKLVLEEHNISTEITV